MKGNQMKLAVIGAGIAGLTCAKEAMSAGHEVTLFDKGRGPGGRCSTRRMPGKEGEIRFDHGAIGFRPQSSEFAELTENWVEAGLVKPWQARIGQLNSAGLIEATDDAEALYYVGLPGMNGLIKGLASELECHFGIRIHEIRQNGGGWVLTFEDDTPDFACDGVICSAPAEQTAILLDGIAPELATQAQHVESSPCWTAMLSFSAPVPVEFDLIHMDGRPFSRLVRNNAKPERGGAEAWVLQASSEWSEDHVDWSADDVLTELVSAFAAATDCSETPDIATAHRWLYATPKSGVGVPASWEPDLKIGTCGDWHIGGTIENAWLSGRVLGERLKTVSSG